MSVKVRTSTGWQTLGGSSAVETAFADGGWANGLAVAAATWTQLPKPPGAPIITPAGAFTENANGSVTIRDAGWYVIEGGAYIPGGAGICALTLGINSLTGENYTAEQQGSQDRGPVLSCSGLLYCNAGSTVYMTCYVGVAVTVVRRWLRIHRIGAGPQGPPGPVGSPPVINQPSALPSSPVDGQEVIYAPNFDPYPYWHLKYRASSGYAYKWEFIGGSPLIARDDTDRSYSSTGAWSATSSPLQIAVPLAGDYDVISRVNIYGESVSGTYYSGVGDTSGVFGTFAAQGSQYLFSGAAGDPQAHGLISNNTAGRILRHWVFGPAGQVVHPRGRVLMITPRRVS